MCRAMAGAYHYYYNYYYNYYYYYYYYSATAAREDGSIRVFSLSGGDIAYERKIGVGSARLLSLACHGPRQPWEPEPSILPN